MKNEKSMGKLVDLRQLNTFAPLMLDNGTFTNPAEKEVKKK